MSIYKYIVHEDTGRGNDTLRSRKNGPGLHQKTVRMTVEEFCLKWNNYQANIVCALGNLKLDEEFVDVTLACGEGQTIKAHKVILSACSAYFKSVLKVLESLL